MRQYRPRSRWGRRLNPCCLPTCRIAIALEMGSVGGQPEYEIGSVTRQSQCILGSRRSHRGCGGVWLGFGNARVRCAPQRRRVGEAGMNAMQETRSCIYKRRSCIMARRERDRSQRSRSLKTVGQLGSSRSSGPQPEQLRGPRARIVQGRETRRCHMSPAIFVGMDVSQDTVDVAVQPGTAFQIANDEQGITGAVTRLQAVQPTLIVLEVSGVN